MADVAIIHGFLVLLTGLMLLIVKSKHRKSIRTIHVTLGVLTSVYGLITYIFTP
jgi:hypothetical protein